MAQFPRIPGRNSSGDPEEFRLTLVEHIDELRTRILRVLAMLVAGMVIGWFAQEPLYAHLNGMFRNSIQEVIGTKSAVKEVFLDATAAFTLKFRLSFAIGITLVFPFIVLQIWGFIAPGLKATEREPLKKLAPLSLVLFLMGAGFCWLILPQAYKFFAAFLLDFNQVELTQEAGKMVMFALKMMLAFGIGFQLPLVVYALGALGLLTSEALIRNWRQASTVIFIVAAIITPSNDAPSMLAMAIPLVILFLLSVYFVNRLQKKRQKIMDTPYESPRIDQ